MKENNENNITYEEAKIILKNSVGDKADQLNAKAEILGAGLVTAIPLIIGSMGVMQGQPIAMPCMLAVALTLNFPVLMDTIQRLRTNKKLLDGSYFEDKSEEEIIAIAKEYKEKYEKYFGNQGGKSL